MKGSRLDGEVREGGRTSSDGRSGFSRLGGLLMFIFSGRCHIWVLNVGFEVGSHFCGANGGGRRRLKQRRAARSRHIHRITSVKLVLARYANGWDVSMTEEAVGGG